MPYSQRDLIYLKDPLKMPDGQLLQHPVLIISSNLSNNRENYYSGVMMSATKHKDKFSFPCFDEMFESPLSKGGCCFRIYIIVSFTETGISKWINRMKPIHFKALLMQIKESVFNQD